MRYFKTQILFTILVMLPSYSAFAYTDRTLFNYITDNIIAHIIVSGGYITIGVLIVSAILSYISKSFRIFFISFLIALCALYMLGLIYEVFDGMSWVPPMYED